MQLVKVSAVILLVGFPVWKGLSASAGVTFRDHADVFSEMMLGPIALLFPLIVVFLTGLTLNSELAARFAANTRSRVGVRRYVAKHVLVIGFQAGVIFFLYAFVAFAVAFLLWPALGDPSIDPAGYNLTPVSAAVDSLTRESYNFLLAYGDIAFGVVYAVWVAFAAVMYAVLGACFLLTIPNRILALSLPFVIYIAGTVAAQLAGFPNLGLSSSVFPQGLAAVTPVEASSPSLIFAAATIVFTAVVIFRAPTNPRLT